MTRPTVWLARSVADAVTGRVTAISERVRVKVHHTPHRTTYHVERYLNGKHRQYWYGPFDDRFGSDRDRAYRFRSTELAEHAIEGCLLKLRCTNLAVVPDP